MRKLNKFQSSKKADISITLLVVLTLLVCLAALYIFYSSGGKVKSQIENYKVIQNFSSAEEKFEFYLLNTAQNVSSEVFDYKNFEQADKEALKKQFLDKFIENYMVNVRVIKEYSGDEYKDQIRKKASYELVLEEKPWILNFKLKNFTILSKPGLEQNQEIGVIVVNKDIVFKIPIKQV